MQHNKQYPWFEANQIHINKTSIRDVTAGATSATVVAPKFSDTLTLFQPGGADCRGCTMNFPVVMSLL